VDVQNEFLNEGGLSPLLKLLVSPNVGLQIRVLTALGNLITNRTFFFPPFPPFFFLRLTTGTSPTVAKAQDRILRAGVLARFTGLLSSSSPLLQLLAIKSISNFISNGQCLFLLFPSLVFEDIVLTLCARPNDAERLFSDLLSGGIGPIISLLASPNEETVLYSAKTLTRATVGGNHLFFYAAAERGPTLSFSFFFSRV
jgi:hypothetical protein